MSQEAKDKLRVFNRFVEAFADKVSLRETEWNVERGEGKAHFLLLDVGVTCTVHLDKEGRVRAEEEKAI